MRKLIVSGFLVIACTAAPSWAQDGGQLYQQKGCAACHGPDGNKPITDAYPKIAGQNKTYAFNQMKDIKSGARDNGQTAVMKPTIQNVSEEEMEAIAEWLSTQTAQ